MFSKLLELTGIGLIAVAIAYWARWEAGILFAGVALVFIGSVTDDAAITASLKRGTAWIRYGWWKQIAKENDVPLPTSPQPPIRVNPQTEEWATNAARQRQERAKLHDRTPALVKQDYDEDFERLG